MIMFCSVHKHEANPASDKTSNRSMISWNDLHCRSWDESRGGGKDIIEEQKKKKKKKRQAEVDSFERVFKMMAVVLDMHCDERLAGCGSKSKLRVGDIVARRVFPNPEWQQQVHNLKAAQLAFHFFQLNFNSLIWSTADFRLTTTLSLLKVSFLPIFWFLDHHYGPITRLSEFSSYFLQPWRTEVTLKWLSTHIWRFLWYYALEQRP